MFVVITGAQFGDEGKGKIVDMMARECDIVARFQGGDNAGHTVVTGGKTYKLHIVPSGVLFGARLLIGPGTVLNPKALLEEISMLANGGIRITPSRLGIDAKTSIIMPYHVTLDALKELKRDVKIGTTGKGIGLAYMDKISREEIRFADIIDAGRFSRKINELIFQKEAAIMDLGGIPGDAKTGIEEYAKIGAILKPYVTDVSREINQALDEGKTVLAEGAQGTHLDVIHGTQKFVTSSSTIAGSACSSLGVGPTRVNEVLGILKAYITRVGEGPLPTEQKNEIGEYLREKGAEYGTTTGRARRCGWFDLPIARKSAILNGYGGIALTKLDVLSGLHPLKICIRYELDGKKMDYPPQLSEEMERCDPVYADFKGWSEDITSARSYAELPDAARKYIEFIEQEMKTKIKFISVGPDREATIVKK